MPKNIMGTIFSIATPVYNGMPAIKKCIGSIRGQILSGTDAVKSPEISALQVEHIVQDGSSEDGGIDFLRQYGAKVRAERVHEGNAYTFFFSSERDEGMYDAINRAWGQSKGDILSWLNADEQYLPGTLSKVAKYFDCHPGVDAVFGDAIITTANGKPYAARREIPLRRCYVANGFLYALSCSTFYRRKLWDSGILKLDTQYRYSSDADLVLRLLSEGIRFSHIDDYLALFGVEKGQNLSFHPEMKIESKAIRKKHGAIAWEPGRKAIMACRYLERLMRGCYRRAPVEYAYAEDEYPHYQSFRCPKLGFRFSYSKFPDQEIKKK